MPAHQNQSQTQKGAPDAGPASLTLDFPGYLPDLAGAEAGADLVPSRTEWLRLPRT